MLWNIVFVFLFLIFLYVLFFFIYCLEALRKPIVRFPDVKEHARFAVLLPARNEEKVITNSIDSLQRQKYPKEDYEIIVVLNNSTDHTGEIVKNLNCGIMEPRIPVHSKGEALQDAFDQLQTRKDIDAYIVFDADNIVDPSFLTEMNKAYQQGIVVAQGRRKAKNTRPNIISKSYELFYVFQNIYFNHARFATGHSASLNGTGWMIRKSWIDENGYPAKTMTEDLECISWFSKTDTKVGYVHEAVTYDEYPEHISVMVRQLRRWIFGQIQCGRVYTEQLMRTVVKEKNAAALDALLVYNMTLFIQLLVVILIAVVCLQPEHIVLLWMHNHFAKCIIMAYAVLVVLGFAGVKKCQYPVYEYLSGILFFPVFISLWLPILLSVQYKKEFAWKQIDHHDAVKIEEAEEHGA